MSLKEKLKDDKTIKAFDCVEKKVAIEKALQLKHDDDVVAIKVGLPLILSCDSKIVKIIKEKSTKPVILDLKISDIPKISVKIIKQAIKLGCDGIIVQGFVGRSVLERCIEECENYGVMVFVVTGMSHEDDTNNLTNSHSEEIANWAIEARADGIIVPANKTNQIMKLKHIVNDNLLVIAAGIGEQGGVRKTAIESGANSVIMGFPPKDKELSGKEFSIPEKIIEIKFHILFCIIFVIVGYYIISDIFQDYGKQFFIIAIVGLTVYLLKKYEEV